MASNNSAAPPASNSIVGMFNAPTVTVEDNRSELLPFKRFVSDEVLVSVVPAELVEESKTESGCTHGSFWIGSR